MANKIKHYGVFVIKTLGESEFVKTMTETLGLPKLQKKEFAVFVFDNELEQVDMLSNIIATHRGCEAVHVDASSKEDFLTQVKNLKEKYEEEEEGDDCEQEESDKKESTYNVVLTDVTISERIPTVKAIKEALNIGLKEAKDIIDKVGDSPTILAEKISKLEADRIARFITSRCCCRVIVTKLN